MSDKCAACGRPIVGGYYEKDGALYDPECWVRAVAPRCQVCGAALVGQYIVDRWNAAYCAEHAGRVPHCTFCGRLVSEGDRGRHGPGRDRIRCVRCRASAISTLERAAPSFARVVEWVGRIGLTYHDLPLRLALATDADLGDDGRTDRRVHGVTQVGVRTRGKDVECDVIGVSILSGLPAVVFQSTLAHELGHAWLAVHGVVSLPDDVAEGFCEVLAHRWLTDVGTDEALFHAEHLAESPDPVYGGGFRRVRAAAVRVGFDAVAASLKKIHLLP